MFAISLFRKVYGPIFSVLIFIVLFLPNYFYRLCIILISKFTLPRGSKIVDRLSAVYSPSFCILSPIGSIVASYVFERTLDTFLIFQTSAELVKKHRKLQCVPTFYWCYNFWVPIPDAEFDLKNHIKEVWVSDGQLLCTTEGGSMEKTLSWIEFREIEKLVLQQVFATGQSPWIVYVVKNVEHPLAGRSDVVIIKFHHGLMDGLSLLKMMNDYMTPAMNLPSISWKPISILMDWWLWIQTVLSLWEMSFPEIKGTVLKVAPTWKEGLIRTPNFYLAESDVISLEIIKGIKRRENVSFVTVVLWAITSAIRTHRLRKGLNPADVYGFVTVPLPDHPDDKLTNHWSWTTIPLPVTLEAGMMQQIQTTLSKREKSVIMMLKRIKLIGGLVIPIHSWVEKTPFSVTISDFPGPAQKFRLWGADCLDIMFSLNFLVGNLGIACSSVSYDGKWKMSFVIDGAVAACQQDADNIASLVSKYITELA